MPSQYNLGKMYERGEGVRQDYIEVHARYNVAGVLGQEGVSGNRDVLASKMDRNQIAKAQERAKSIMAEISKKDHN